MISLAAVVAVAVPAAVAIPTSAYARFMPSHQLRRASTCMMETGRSYRYCKLSASERRAHDERARRLAEAKRRAEEQRQDGN